ncbi:MAG: hypothetical protein KJ737_10735 [Proteobacteria bacterium]|nr:hypothetical protein [Pseudomonadota bacterium]
MKKIQRITHKGKNIFFADYSSYKNREDKENILETLNETMAIMKQQPQNSALMLTDVTNIFLEKDLSDQFTEMVEHNKPYVKKSAVIGVSGFKKSIHNIMMALTGRQIKIFPDIDAAKDWLTED